MGGGENEESTKICPVELQLERKPVNPTWPFGVRVLQSQHNHTHVVRVPPSRAINLDVAFLLTVGSFLLTVEPFYIQLPILDFYLQLEFVCLQLWLFTYSWSFFAYSGKVRLIRAVRDCKQRSSTVSKKAPTVSKKASPSIFSRSCLQEGATSMSPYFHVALRKHW